MVTGLLFTQVYWFIVTQVLHISTWRQSQPFLSHSVFLLCPGWHSSLCSHVEKQSREVIQLKHNQPKSFCFSVWYIFCHASSCAGMARRCQREQESEGLEVEWHLLELDWAALPANSKLCSERYVILSPFFGIEEQFEQTREASEKRKNFICFIHT